MSSKAELHFQLNEIGYELGPFTFKDTLSIILQLHSIAVSDKNINVAKLHDLDLRKSLTKHGFIVGPITNHTRAIYQRKLLEALTNQTSEGEEDQFEITPSTYDTLADVKPFIPTDSLSSYKLQNDEPMILRHDSKSTPKTRNVYRDSNLYDDTIGIRPRISTKPNEQGSINVNKQFTPKNDKLQVATKNGGGTFLYASITIVVALVVFVVYLWFEK